MYIEINGINFFYVSKGEGPPIILIHGGGESHKVFQRTINDLCKNYTVYAIDLRGQGKSDKVKALHYEDMADDIIEFINKKNIKNPYFFGFSGGGVVGLIASFKEPKIFRKMLIAGANSSPNGIKKKWLIFFKALYFFTHRKFLKLILEEPNITAAQLNQITIETIVVYGQRDAVKDFDRKYILKNLRNGSLITIKKEGHLSYVLNNKKLTKVILEYLLNE